MLLRTNCKKIFHSLSLLVTNSPEYPTLRGGREPTSLVWVGTTSARPPGRRSRAAFIFSEHDPEKWEPVFRKDHAPTKGWDHDPIQSNRIM